MNEIVTAQRIHSQYVQKSVNQLNRYIMTKDKIRLEESIEYIDTAINISRLFGAMGEYMETYSQSATADTLYQAFPYIFNNKPNHADRLMNRVNIMLALNLDAATNGINLSAKGERIGKQMKSELVKLREDNKHIDYANINNVVDEFQQHHIEFTHSINQINTTVEKALNYFVAIIILLLGGLVFIFSNIVSKTISGRLLVLVENLKTVAGGSFKIQKMSPSRDETGNLTSSIQQLLDQLQEISLQTKKISEGDFSKPLVPLSAEDELGHSLRGMTLSLKKMTEDIELQNYYRNGQNSLHERIRGNLNVDKLTKKILSFLCGYLDASIGTFYIQREEKQVLNLISTYAIDKNQILHQNIKEGEGILGQVAIDKKMKLLANVPDNYMKISSAIGEETPNNLIFIPLQYEDRLIGIIEIGSFFEFKESEIQFLKLITETLAISVYAAQSREATENYLEKTREQAELLQEQQEELRVTNEELEDQAQALRESERELQAQQEELRVTNEELEEKSSSLLLKSQEIEAQNEELEGIRSDLIKKADELENTSRYKSEFLANMSHELRTPLNSLLILSKSLADNKHGNLSEQQIEYAGIIHKSGYELLDLINDILDLSKIESGKMSINLEPVNLDEIQASLEQSFNHMVAQKGLYLNIENNSQLEQIDSDRQRLIQILKNLLSNAIKFTKEGGITVEFIRPDKKVDLSRSGLKHEESFGIRVHDTGIGIPEEKLKEIFEAFQQVDGSISRNFGGTGLGLSISKEFTRLLSGEIQVESTVGTGSCFCVYFPIHQGSHESTYQADTTAVTVKKVKENGSSANQNTIINQSIEVATTIKVEDDRDELSDNDKVILIIEDDIVFANSLAEECHLKGLKSLIASNGEEGIQMAMTHQPYGIILDLKLPDISGEVVLERLKQNVALRHIPVHIMSSNDKNDELIRRGAIGFLQKPAGHEAFSKVFDRIISITDKPIKDLLIIEDDSTIQKSLTHLIDDDDVKITIASTGKEALDVIQKIQFDSVILDLGLPDLPGFDVLDQMMELLIDKMPPVVIYTGRDLTAEENVKLKKYTGTVIQKGSKSQDRLLDETSLFLHRIVDKLSSKKKGIIENLYNKEAIFKDKKILIVDDDMRNIFALTSVLEEREMDVVEAENGKIALEMLKKHTDIDLVIMDIMMPEMDGYEATREIRKNYTEQELPVIALTAKAMKDDREKCIAAGANDYLTKPLNVDKLISLLRVWLYK